jgi:phosphatidate cytidylyltransferase
VKRVLTAVILIPIVVLALFRAPLWLFALLVLGVALLAAREYFDIAEANGVRPFHSLCYVLTVCVFIAAYAAGESVARRPASLPMLLQMAGGAAILLLIFSPFILLAAGMSRDLLTEALPDSAASFLLLPYVGVPLGSMVLVRSFGLGALFLFFMMLVVWSGDIAAYYVGRVIGRHKLAPRISPGKTWEGAIASVIGATLVGVVTFHYSQPICRFFIASRILSLPYSTVLDTGFTPLLKPAPVALVIVFSTLTNVAAQIGDLAESMLKRGGNLKDSGTLLPGHGGVLDRIDALLFAAPVGWIFYFTEFGKYFRNT